MSAPPSLVRIKKEYKEVRELKDDSGVSAELVGDSFIHWKGKLRGPAGTPYEGGIFIVDIQIPPNYPFEPPKMRFDTRVWHPNISSANGAICLDILKCLHEDTRVATKRGNRRAKEINMEDELIGPDGSPVSLLHPPVHVSSVDPRAASSLFLIGHALANDFAATKNHKICVSKQTQDNTQDALVDATLSSVVDPNGPWGAVPLWAARTRALVENKKTQQQDEENRKKWMKSMRQSADKTAVDDESASSPLILSCVPGSPLTYGLLPPSSSVALVVDVDVPAHEYADINQFNPVPLSIKRLGAVINQFPGLLAEGVAIRISGQPASEPSRENYNTRFHITCMDSSMTPPPVSASLSFASFSAPYCTDYVPHVYLPSPTSFQSSILSQYYHVLHFFSSQLGPSPLSPAACAALSLPLPSALCERVCGDLLLTPISSIRPLFPSAGERMPYVSLTVSGGRFCLSDGMITHNSEWSPALTLRTALLSLQALLSTPNPDDPQDAQVAGQYKKDFKAFQKTAAYWTETYAKPAPVIDVKAKVAKLQEMGFPADKCLAALEKCKYDENAALDYLFSM